VGPRRRAAKSLPPPVDDLISVGLHEHRPRAIGGAGEVEGQLAAAAEARVGRAAGEVAGDREVVTGAGDVAGLPGDDDLAVGLDGDRVDLLGDAAPADGDHAGGAEVGVGTAVGQEA
jgi:hypothetical protein